MKANRIVADVPNGTVCAHQGWWGVLESRDHHRPKLDRWHAEKIRLSFYDEVYVPGAKSRRIRQTKRCEVCGREYHRPAGISSKSWRGRRFCTEACRRTRVGVAA